MIRSLGVGKGVFTEALTTAEALTLIPSHEHAQKYSQECSQEYSQKYPQEYPLTGVSTPGVNNY